MCNLVRDQKKIAPCICCSCSRLNFPVVIKTSIHCACLYIFDCFCFKISCFIGSYERCLQKAYVRTEILTSDGEKSALAQDEGNVGISQQQKVLCLWEKNNGAVFNSCTLFIELNAFKV